MVQYLQTGLPNQSLSAVQICPFRFCKSSQLLVDAFQHMQHPPLRHTLQVQWVARLYTSHRLQSPAKQQDFLTCKDNVVGWKIELL
jgi:hypothetical protein